MGEGRGGDREIEHLLSELSNVTDVKADGYADKRVLLRG